MCHYHNLHQLVKIIEVLQSSEKALYNSYKFHKNRTQSLGATHSYMENSEKVAICFRKGGVYTQFGERREAHALKCGGWKDKLNA